MTNHWIDLKNADVILVMGGNPAENHPISMKWIMRAGKRAPSSLLLTRALPGLRQRLICMRLCVPARTSPSSAGMIKYILDNNLYFREYVVNYTNASYLVNPDFKMPGQLNGHFLRI